MSPIQCMVLVILVIGLENTLIERCYPTVSPVLTMGIYGVTMIVMSAIAYPLRQQIGLDWTESPMPQIPWVVLGAIIFYVGATAYFAAYARGGSKELVVTTLALLPVSVAVFGGVIDRKLPSINVMGACLLALGALMLLKRDFAAQAKIAAESTANLPG